MQEQVADRYLLFVVRISGRIHATYPFGVDQIYRKNDALTKKPYGYSTPYNLKPT